MVYLQIFVIIFSLCSIQLSNTYLAQIIITLFNFLSFLLPFRTISESGGIVYLFSFNRLIATFVTFIVNFATVFTRLLNVLTSLNKNRAPGIQALCTRKAMRYYLTIQFYHTTIGNFGKALKSDCVFFSLCFHLQVHPYFEQPVAKLNPESI